MDQFSFLLATSVKPSSCGEYFVQRIRKFENASFFQQKHLINRLARGLLPPVSWVTNGHHSHELQVFRKAEEFADRACVLQYLSQPDRSKPQGMCRQQHVLQACSYGLMILDVVVDGLPVDKNSNEGLRPFYHSPVTRQVCYTSLEFGVADGRKAPGLVIQSGRCPHPGPYDLDKVLFFDRLGREVPNASTGIDSFDDRVHGLSVPRFGSKSGANSHFGIPDLIARVKLRSHSVSSSSQKESRKTTNCKA